MVKIAVLTTGHIHTPNFVKKLKEKLASGEVQIAGVWDSNKALAEKNAKELGVPVLADYAGVLADASVPAVVITGTTVQHDGLAAQCAAAGKHLFIEKPLATTGAEAWRIFSAIKESGVLFQTGHFQRYDRLIRFVKQEVDAGNLGTITRARHSTCHGGAMGGWFEKEYRWFFLKEQSGGGGFYDLGCHSVDILNFLFGPVQSVTAALATKTVRYPSIDEYGEGLLKFKSGVIASVAAGWVDVANPITLQVAGTEGHAVVVQGQLYYQSAKTKVAGADGKTPIDPSNFPEVLPHAFDIFFDVLNGKRDKSMLIPVEDALNVALAMEAMYEADRIGGWVKV